MTPGAQQGQKLLFIGRQWPRGGSAVLILGFYLTNLIRSLLFHPGEAACSASLSTAVSIIAPLMQLVSVWLRRNRTSPSRPTSCPAPGVTNSPPRCPSQPSVAPTRAPTGATPLTRGGPVPRSCGWTSAVSAALRYHPPAPALALAKGSGISNRLH